MQFNFLVWLRNQEKKYLDVSEMASFAISFKSPSKVRAYISIGSKLQNHLIRILFYIRTKLPKLIGKLVPLIQLYKRHFLISDVVHQKILYFLGRPPETKLKDLAGFDRKEYKRYQKLFAKKHTKPVSLNIPFIPDIFLLKTGVVNFQETIDFFKSLYIAEREKSSSS